MFESANEEQIKTGERETDGNKVENKSDTNKKGYIEKTGTRKTSKQSNLSVDEVIETENTEENIVKTSIRKSSKQSNNALDEVIDIENTEEIKGGTGIRKTSTQSFKYLGEAVETESAIEADHADIVTEETGDEEESRENDELIARRNPTEGKEPAELSSASTEETTDTSANGTILPVGSVDSNKTNDNGKTNDIKSTIAGNGVGLPGIVVTTEPTATGLPKQKANLVRRKTLNPRVMAPPGVEALENLPMIAIRQQMDMDINGGCGSPNTYRIWDEHDELIFFATEESGCLCRWACGPSRRFSLDVVSAHGDQVLNFHRTCCRCDCCCCLDCFMCLQKLYVVDCLGRTLGAVKQKFTVFNPKFDIVDHDNNVLFKIHGPCCPCRCATEIYFQILNKTGDRQIGRIQKKWGGDRTDNVNVDHEYFDVTFPGKLDSVDKALILGAAFLVNYMYLEMS